MAVAGQTEFDVTIPYLDGSHIHATAGGQMASFEWLTAARIRLTQPVAQGIVVTIYRQTPIDNALVTFQRGAVLTEEDLNKATLQVLYVQQELTDLYNSALGAALVRLGNNLGITTNPDAVADEMAQLVLQSDLLVTFQQQLADIDAISESIIQNAMRTADLRSLIENLTYIDGTPVGTVIQQNQQQLTDGLTAIASTLALIGALSGDGQSFILDTTKVLAAPGQTLAQKFTGLDSTDTANAASIQSLSQTVTSNDTAYAQKFNTLGAYNAVAGTYALDNTKVLVTPTQSLGTYMSGIQSQFTTADTTMRAFVGTQITAATGPGSSVATSITNLQTTQGSHTASISSLLSTTNGLSAKAGVALDVNGYITGWTLNNNGSSGSATFLVSTFAIVDPGNGIAPFVPFEVSGGVVRMPNVRVSNLEADTITASNLQVGAVTTPAIAVNTVTKTEFYSDPNSVTITTTPVVVATDYVTCDDAQECVSIVFSTDLYNHSTSQTPLFTLQCQVDGVTIKTTNNRMIQSAYGTFTHVAVAITPGAGLHRIDIVATNNLTTEAYKQFCEITTSRWKR